MSTLDLSPEARVVVRRRSRLRCNPNPSQLLRLHCIFCVVFMNAVGVRRARASGLKPSCPVARPVPDMVRLPRPDDGASRAAHNHYGSCSTTTFPSTSSMEHRATGTQAPPPPRPASPAETHSEKDERARKLVHPVNATRWTSLAARGCERHTPELTPHPASYSIGHRLRARKGPDNCRSKRIRYSGEMGRVEHVGGHEDAGKRHLFS
ncbi:hypothetical protein C8R45DRAFT_548878 [Mycena sanguinolenta]|nr:hypothetical protein C8R45DRAFT_548878 [Mycena sanguinolenta]